MDKEWAEPIPESYDIFQVSVDYKEPSCPTLYRSLPVIAFVLQPQEEAERLIENAGN